MTPGQVDALNQEFRGTCVVMMTGTSSHMWDSRVAQFYFDEILTQAFRQKRADLGVDAKAKGAILFDKAPA